MYCSLYYIGTIICYVTHQSLTFPWNRWAIYIFSCTLILVVKHNFALQRSLRHTDRPSPLKQMLINTHLIKRSLVEKYC